ncbi:MAG: EAL domain-containing protein [Cyanobacteria bacterium J069]|nr:MAG: EAL domain-containing protein [Cyanobacteria bacterium J069]
MLHWLKPPSKLPLKIQRMPLVKTAWEQLLPGVIASLLVLGLIHLGLVQSLEHLGYNALFKLRGPIPWSSQVVIIEIDETSQRTTGQALWTHDRYADLITILSQSQPRAIVLNTLLSETDPQDAALVEAMEASGRVVLGQSWTDSDAAIVPPPALRAAAVGMGHVFSREDLDGLVRQIRLRRYGVPSLSLVAANLHLRPLGERVSVGQADQTLWINWPGPASETNRYSYMEVIQRQVPLQFFRDKVVLVGVSTAPLNSLQTPFDQSVPVSDMYLQAAAISNLLEQNDLHRPGGGWQGLLLLLGGPVLSFGLMRWPFERQLITWLGLCFSWLLLAMLLFHYQYWIPVAMPVLLVTLTGAAVALREQSRTNLLLRQSEERYALAVQGSNEGLWDWNLLTDQVYYSPRWKEMLGWDETEVGDRLEEWYERVHPDDLDSLKAALSEHLNGHTAHFEHEHRMIHREGNYRWMLTRGVAIKHRDGTAYRIAGSQSDITQRKEAEDRLWHNAYYDDLTGLPNRAFFLDRLRQAIAFSQEYPLCFHAVLLLDLDRFQVVNNSLGNTVGDQLLIATAHRLKGFLPSEAVVSRLPGDEFAILLPNIEDEREATRTAEQLQQILARPFNIGDQEVYITISIGIAISSARYSQAEHMLQDADTALHRAKASGKARHQVFDPTMHNRMLARLKLENDLRRAIAQEERYAMIGADNPQPELFLHYQPLIQLNTRQIIGFEALIRWYHPNTGFLSPAKFIPMAEETGQIIPLGWWILRQACRQMNRWQMQFPNLPPLTINVNLSSRQFSLPDLTQQIQGILYETGLDASNLKLEITEGTIMENGRAVIDMLYQLRSLGIQLAIDDFGTGYSSLSYLYRFPINTLKIDRSFIAKMHTDKDSAAIVRTIINLAHSLGLDVTAEGVENPDQVTRLQEMDCEFGQGFLFSRAIDAEAAEVLLSQTELIQDFT